MTQAPTVSGGTCIVTSKRIRFISKTGEKKEYFFDDITSVRRELLLDQSKAVVVALSTGEEVSFGFRETKHRNRIADAIQDVMPVRAYPPRTPNVAGTQARPRTVPLPLTDSVPNASNPRNGAAPTIDSGRPPMEVSREVIDTWLKIMEDQAALLREGLRNESWNSDHAILRTKLAQTERSMEVLRASAQGLPVDPTTTAAMGMFVDGNELRLPIFPGMQQPPSSNSSAASSPPRKSIPLIQRGPFRTAGAHACNIREGRLFCDARKSTSTGRIVREPTEVYLPTISSLSSGAYSLQIRYGGESGDEYLTLDFDTQEDWERMESALFEAKRNAEDALNLPVKQWVYPRPVRSEPARTRPYELAPPPPSYVLGDFTTGFGIWLLLLVPVLLWRLLMFLIRHPKVSLPLVGIGLVILLLSATSS